MKTVYFVLVVSFAMEKFSASAQQFTVSACKDGVLQLNCLTGHSIRIERIVLGDSRCSGRSCCPRQGDCNKAPSAPYENRVHTTCNGRPSCSMNAEIRNIGCSVLGPSNDYTNITYSCMAIQTSPASTIPSTPYPTILSSSSVSTWQHSTTSNSTPINTSPFRSDDKKTTEFVAILNPTHPKKPETMAQSEQGKSASQVQTDNGYLDRVTTLVAVIAGGVVITATVISVAIVLVLRKRRIAKSEEQYDLPNYSCNANNDDENVRNSNFYEIIPDSSLGFDRDSGHCSTRDSANAECSEKENDYLTPVIESEYLSIV